MPENSNKGKHYYKNALRKTYQRKFKGKIYGFDIETCNDNKEFVCASIVENLDEGKYWVFTEKDELIDFLKQKRFYKSIITASNLQFDFFGVFHQSKELTNFNLLFRGSSLIFAKTYIKGHDFQQVCQKKDKDGKKIGRQGESLTFIDTFNYCNLSVEKLGKILNLPKLEKPNFLGRKPQTQEEWDQLINYNLRDSEISRKYLEFLYKSFEELGATPKLTIASTSMSLFKNKYLDDTYFRHSVEVLDEQFKGYYGGRTEVFERGSIVDYNYYDFNSLYPSVMQSQVFPDPNSLRITKRNTLDYIKKYHGMSKVTIHCPDMKHPLLPYRYNNKLLFPTGTFTGYYTHVELWEALSIGYTIKEVHKTFYYKKTCKPFKEFVTDLYNKRLEYQSQNNPMQQVTKLLMNSLYGKFGQKFRDRDNWEYFNHTLDELHKMDGFEVIGDFIRVKKEFVNPSSFCIPIWASYVTAYGRVKLHRAIAISDPVYCDTDSLITRKELPCSNELGDLKLEMKIKAGIIVKPKMYALADQNNNDYVKIKGVSKKFNFFEFSDMLKDPKVHYVKFTKFKEAIRRGLIPNELQDQEKNLTLEDEKREWLHPFNPAKLESSIPIHLIDGIPEKEYLYTENEKNLNMDNTLSIIKE